ncbi:SDR family oxidoreductase [Mycobacterium vicinigordonae]|uniref:Peroxisomal trans-2-enoyl-CoA reductase n=1 Tax=Mycobacterium vicinigordonae TaxID=1719132 RepID=A0A7D6ECT4_9MYCO|nr:SDR family oxidoreductase [Mycobacterium vicinigordonae]QLL09805.1 SDR family oxidoreductase [Mycobacterium vicinigordonae]
MPLPTPPPVGTAMLPPRTYAGKVVIVTGGGTGLGKAMAVEFARLGAGIAVASRKAEHRENGVQAVAALGARAIGVELDVRNDDAVASTFDRIEEELGPADVLINNAAGNFPSQAVKMSANAWRSVVDIVLNGTFLCSAEFARRAIARTAPGAILNIGATYSWTGGPGTAHSAAAKAGVMNLTQSLAVEWAPNGIRVNCLAPGLFPHDDLPPVLLARQNPEADCKRIPGGRVGQPHELGWAATYLCSPYAAYLTGHTMVLDGANWLRRGLAMPDFVPIDEQFP